MYFLWYLLIGVGLGWIVHRINRDEGMNLVIGLVSGMIGGILGGWIFSLVGVIPVGKTASLFTAAGGALLLLMLSAQISRRKK